MFAGRLDWPIRAKDGVDIWGRFFPEEFGTLPEG